MPKPIDVLLGLSVAAVTTGVALIYVPAGLICAGLINLAMILIAERGR